MAWEYLNSSELDDRLRLIAGLIAPRLAGKRVLDLNCGVARLLLFLREDNWLSYRGNDTDRGVLEIARSYVDLRRHCRVEMSLMPDDHTMYPCDMLLVLGHGAGEKKRSIESPTLTASMLRIAKCHKPAYILVEGVSHWEERFRLYSEISARLGQLGYGQTLRVRFNLEPPKSSWLTRREIWQWELPQ